MNILEIIQDIKYEYFKLKKQYSINFEEMLNEINNSYYTEMFKPILIKQNNEEYPSFCLFRYDRIDDPNTFWNRYDGLYRTLRSCVIDIQEVKYIIRPFEKFFNINELPETSLENIKHKIETAKNLPEFSEKLDGSMICATLVNGDVFCSSSKCVSKNESYRIKNALDMITKDHIRMMESYQFNDYTFIFEYINKDDKHIVDYKDEDCGLYLIGVVSNKYGICSNYEYIKYLANTYNIKSTYNHKTTLEDILNNLDSKKSSEAEGFVINIDGYRVKLKYHDYLNVNSIAMSCLSPNIIIKHIANNTFDDFISVVPESLKKQVNDIAIKIITYKEKQEEKIKTVLPMLKGFNTRKDVAQYIIKNYPDIKGDLFLAYDGKEYNPLKTSNGYKKMDELN